MDLEELKASWNVLNERLAQSEVVSQRMVREMIAGKTKSAYDKIFAANVRNLILIFLMVTVVFPVVYMHTPLLFASFLLIEAVMLTGLAAQGYKVWMLSKFDVEARRSSEMLGLMLRYRRAYLNDVRFSVPAVCLVMAAFYVLEIGYNETVGYLADWRTLLPVCLSLACVGLGFSVSSWFRRRHDRQVAEVEQGLRELREFEEA